MGDDAVAKACEPWRHHLGPPPPPDSPLAGVFGAGMVYVERLLSDVLGVSEYEAADPTGDADADMKRTLGNILDAAGIARPPDVP